MTRVWSGIISGSVLLLGCSGGGGPTGASEAEAPAEAAPGSDVADASDGAATADAPAAGASILAAYHGLDRLIPRVMRICNPSSVGKDGLPVTFSVRLNAETLEPEDFVVETASGEKATPVCATLAPADEPLELRTVLLAGTFGTPDAPPRAVEVVGELEDVDGASIKGLRTTTIVPLAAGPSLVMAERFDPTTPGLAEECPEATQQVVQLTWQGGVTGPDGAELGEPQRRAVTVTLEDGTTVTPIALADDDPDNFVHACLDVATPAASVTVSAGHFHDPGDDANPETRVEAIDG